MTVRVEVVTRYRPKGVCMDIECFDDSEHLAHVETIRRALTEWPPEAIEAAARAIEAEVKRWPVEDHPMGWGQRVPSTGWFGATMTELAEAALAAALGHITGDNK